MHKHLGGFLVLVYQRGLEDGLIVGAQHHGHVILHKRHQGVDFQISTHAGQQVAGQAYFQGNLIAGQTVKQHRVGGSGTSVANALGVTVFDRWPNTANPPICMVVRTRKVSFLQKT